MYCAASFYRGKRYRDLEPRAKVNRLTPNAQTTMNFSRLLLSIAIIVALGIALYLSIAFPLLRDPAPTTAVDDDSSAASEAEVSLQESISPGGIASATAEFDGRSQPTAGGGRKLVEIFGRVLDAEKQPIEGALIAEERYFTSTRSDADGRYQLRLDLPRHRYPILHVLRSGYDGKRFRLGKAELDTNPVHELNVTMQTALNSVRLRGWVSNDLGLGLEGARVELSATYSRNSDSYYLTVFTDEQGNFEFDGVRAGETYKLSINLTPEYPFYEDPDFVVTQNPPDLNIELQTLRFVDLDGMIVNRDAVPVPAYEIYATNLSTGIHTRKIVSDSSGFFTLPNFPLGEVRLATRGAEYYQISGLRLGEDSYQNLELIVDRGSHYLSGWVSDENGVAVPKAMVTLDRKFRRGEVEYTSYRSQGTTGDGGFAFTDLGSGEHRVTVYAFGYARQEFMHRFDDQADELHIRLGTLE